MLYDIEYLRYKSEYFDTYDYYKNIEQFKL